MFDLSKYNIKRDVLYTEVMDEKLHALGMYRATLFYLYDGGFIDDPTVFDINAYCIENSIKGFISSSGKAGFTIDGARLSRLHYLGEGYEEELAFLDLVIDALYWYNCVLSIDSLWESKYQAKFVTAKKVFARSLGISQKVKGFTLTGGDNSNITESVVRIVSGEVDGHLRRVSTASCIYDMALEELGLDVSKAKEYEFIKGLSYEDMLDSLQGILDGSVTLNGKDSGVLDAWLEGYQKGYNDTLAKVNAEPKHSCGLYTYILRYKTDEYFDNYGRLLEGMLHDIVAVDSTGFWLKTKDFRTRPLGIFTVTLDENLSTSCSMGDTRYLGYTGEVIPVSLLADDSKEMGISYVGCPLRLPNTSGGCDYFMDVFNTSLYSKDSWFSISGVRLGGSIVSGVDISDSIKSIASCKTVDSLKEVFDTLIKEGVLMYKDLNSIKSLELRKNILGDE